jgi:multiple sugar transport system permease protein
MTFKGNAISKRNRMGYVYIMPWIIGFLGFQIAPILYSLYISFHKWDMFGAPKFVGWLNFQNLMADPRFMISLRNTLLFSFFSMVFGISLALFIAALLAENIKGSHFYRTVFYLPSLVVPVALGMMIRPIFGGQNYGLLNLVLSKIGIENFQWLDKPELGIWVIILTNFWFIGACMIIFLAGIKGISKTYYEAAEIDGAGWFCRLFNVTIPMLSPVLFFQIVTGIIYGLQIFDIPISLANLGGNSYNTMGQNDSLASLVYYLFIQGFRNWNMGKASAIGWIIFLIGLLLSLIVIKFQRDSCSAQQID